MYGRFSSLFLSNQSPLIALSLLSSFFSLLWHSANAIPHRTCTPAIIYTAPPNSSLLLTIFYIFYRPTPRTLRILLFSRFLFQTVQNVDASFLNSVPILSLLCPPPLRSLVRLSRAECTFSPVSGPFLSSLSSLWFPPSQTTFHPPPPVFLTKPGLEHVPVTVPSDFSRSRSIACQ